MDEKLDLKDALAIGAFEDSSITPEEADGGDVEVAPDIQKDKQENDDE